MFELCPTMCGVVEQVLITSGAMTFLVLAATLVTATFLFSPTIEQIFGNIPYHQTLFVIVLVNCKLKCPMSNLDPSDTACDPE